MTLQEQITKNTEEIRKQEDEFRNMNIESSIQELYRLWEERIILMGELGLDYEKGFAAGISEGYRIMCENYQEIINQATGNI